MGSAGRLGVNMALPPTGATQRHVQFPPLSHGDDNRTCLKGLCEDSVTGT